MILQRLVVFLLAAAIGAANAADLRLGHAVEPDAIDPRVHNFGGNKNLTPNGMQSWTDPAHPACLAPGKRPRLTPNPSIAMSGSGWIMPFGSSGDDVQPRAMLHVFLNRVVFGMTPRAAIEQPRFASSSFPGSSDPHAYAPRRMTLERRFDDATAASLDRMGHNVNWWREWEWKAGCVRAIVKDNTTGLLEGGADVRRPNGVRGW